MTNCSLDFSHPNLLEKWVKQYKLGHVRPADEELSDDTHLLEKWIKQYKLGRIRQYLKTFLFEKLEKREQTDRQTDRQFTDM